MRNRKGTFGKEEHFRMRIWVENPLRRGKFPRRRKFQKKKQKQKKIEEASATKTTKDIKRSPRKREESL
jgi:hypothetical protein